MRRFAFPIFACVSLLLSLATVALWAASYQWPGTVTIYNSGATKVPLPAPASAKTSAVFLDSRAGHVILLMQWSTLLRQSDDPQHTYVDAGNEAWSVTVGAFKQWEELAEGGRTFSMVSALDVPDVLNRTPSRTLRILLWQCGIAYEADDPGPLRLMLRKYGGYPSLEVVRAIDVAADGTFPVRLSGYPQQHAAYRQLMLPYWLLVTLWLVLPLLWLRTNRRSVRWARKGRCPGCGYDLCATPDRCPECGRASRGMTGSTSCP